MTRSMLLLILLLANPTHALEVSALQWRIGALVETDAPTINFAPWPCEAPCSRPSVVHTDVVDSVLPLYPPHGCLIAIRSAHLAAKDGDRTSYLVIQGITSVSRDSPLFLDPPYMTSMPVHDLTLINNAPFRQWMNGLVTGYLICGIPPGEEANAWTLAIQEGLVR